MAEAAISNLANERLDWHKASPEQAIKELDSSMNGLDKSEAKHRLGKYGFNELKQERSVSRLSVFANQFRSILVIILIAATIFSALIGEIIDAIAIMIIVILNGVFGYVQEYKAEKTIEALKKMTKPETIVIRNGKTMTIASKELVPGDIVLLEQGSRVTADLRLLEITDLKIDESAITGESVPVLKRIDALRGKVQLADMKNMAWASTMVTYGRGKGVVVGTGMTTEIGRIAHIVEEKGEEPTPLQKKLDAFGKSLGIIILAISILVIVIGIVREGPLVGMPMTQELIVGMIITGIALAVAAIPEGLPAVVTITLALGLQKLAKSNALIRKLPAVETLGSTTVICSDKTGTLTKNEMTVKSIWLPGYSASENNHGRYIAVEGEGYEPKGGFEQIIESNGKHKGSSIDVNRDASLSKILKIGALCNNAKLVRPGGKGEWKIIGDPTEGALTVAATKAGMTSNALRKQFHREKEIPFSSERAMMTTVNKQKSGRQLVCVKGAPETILERCTRVMGTNSVIPLRDGMKKKILESNHAMTNRALRVLGIAYKETSAKENDRELERHLTFVGLVGMIDPPREGVKKDIEMARNAGIKVVMITGDHQNTAIAIAEDIGITHSTNLKKVKSITGKELDRMSSSDLVKVVDQVSVYARVNPEHKMKIIEALHKRGHIVAMTGDGVNDAPALKASDIGIAMGIKGTDVAKEASDMVLRDDHFASIVGAVKGGRSIYDNIKKFIQYMLSSNIGEVLIVFIAVLIGMGYHIPSESGVLLFIPVIGALQLLWINILTDLFPALALGVDPPSPGIMDQPPRDPKEKLLSRGMLTDIVFVGGLMAAAVLLLFWINNPVNPIMAATIAFTAIVVFEMVRVQAVRMRYKVGIFSNKKLIIAMIVSICLQLTIVYIPFFQPIFNTVSLGFAEWSQIIAVSLVLMVIMYVKEKFFRSRI
jgi:Ca2+-transporting ATPase